MTDVENLEVKDLVLFHEEVAKKYPEIERGVLNESMLDSVVKRPFVGFGGYSPYTTIFEQAACLLEGIIRYHPFVDGNKRTALLATENFLRRNGHEIFIHEGIPSFLVEVAKHNADTEEETHALITIISKWLKAMVAVSPTSPSEPRRRPILRSTRIGFDAPPRFVKNKSRPGYSVYAKNARSGDWVTVTRLDGRKVRLKLGKPIGSDRFKIRRLYRPVRLRRFRP